MIRLAIHSVPRSGSSWLGELINSSEFVNYSFQPLFSYRFKSFLDENSTKEDIDYFFDSIKLNDDEFIRQKEAREKGIKPVFNKSSCRCIAYKEVRYHYILDNLLKSDKNIKIIALVRNPLSVIASWYSASREFRKDLGWSLDDELLFANKKNEGKKEEYFGLMKWIETTKEFERLNKEYKDRVYLIKYDDLIEDTSSEVNKLFQFIGLERSQQVDNFLKSKSINSDTYSVFKYKENDEEWKNILSDHIKKLIIETVTHFHLDKYL